MKHLTRFLAAASTYLLLGAGCSLSSPVTAQEEPPSQRVLVFVVWTDKDFSIQGADMAGEAKSPQGCHDLTTADLAAHVKDWKAMSAKGYVPHLACGLAVPDDSFHGAPKPAPEVGTSPGAPDQPQQPSGGI